MGRMISETQRDWDLLLPYVMAAYRSSVHRSTGYTPNYLMFAREVKSPTDLVFGTSTDPPPALYDDYSVAMEDRMKRAYDLVRRELGVAAERIKRQYDIQVRPLKFHRGDWVLYFSPRNVQGRQQKWQRKYSPYLVIKEFPPVNYLIQKSSRSRPIIAHVDKLKSWATDHPPRSWLKPDDSPAGDDQFEPAGDVRDGMTSPAGDNQFDSPAGDNRDGVTRSDGDDRMDMINDDTVADVDFGQRKEVGAPSLRSPRSGANVLFRQREGTLATPSFCSLREPSCCEPVMVNGHPYLTGGDEINFSFGRAPDDGDGIVTPGVSNVIDGMVTDCGHRQGHINETSPGVIDDGVGPGYRISGRDNGQSGRVDGDWSRRYTLSRGDGERRPGGTSLGHSDRRRVMPRSSTDRSDWIGPTSSNDAVAAIAGDPESVQQRRDHPRRAGRIPDRYKDFVMDRFAWSRPMIPFPYGHFNDYPDAGAGDFYLVQCRRSCLPRAGRISDWCRNPVMN